MGLGAYPTVSLKEARREAEFWQSEVREGKDAIKERERQRRVAARNMHILSEIALDAFESRKAELKGDGKALRVIEEAKPFQRDGSLFAGVRKGSFPMQRCLGSWSVECSNLDHMAFDRVSGTG